MAAYPRKPTVVIFAICVIAVGGVAYSVYGQSIGKNLVQNTDSPLSVVTETSAPVANTDWQKQFLNNEVSGGTFKATNKTELVETEENLTATDQLGREFFAKYATLKQSGLTSDPQVVGNAILQVAKDSVNGLNGPKTYSEKDLAVVANTQASLSAYGRFLLAAFQDHMPKENEAIVANQAFQNNDMGYLTNIDPIIAGYKDMLAYLLNIPVPQPLLQYHITLTNGVSISLYNAESFRHMDVDPVRGLSAISLEMIGLQNIASAFASIQSYFVSAGVLMGS